VTDMTEAADETDRDLYFNAVADLVREAGNRALSYYGTRVTVEEKENGTPVTIADRRAEQLAHEWIEKRFPSDGIMGEELGAVRPDSRRRWIIDPIDATKSFVRGVPLWGTLVAVVDGDEVIAGAAYYPGVSELLVAAPGKGCWWNGGQSYVSPIDRLEHALVVTTDERFMERPERGVRWNELAGRAGMTRTWGDCFGYLLVATGRAEVMVDDVVAPWDAAAFYPIITEAGGVFTSWSGDRTAFGNDVIATNGALDAAVRGILIP